MEPGVCKKFEKASDNIAEKMTDIVDNEIDMDEVINKVDILQDKAKFAAFSKTRIKTRKKLLLHKDQGSIEANKFLTENLNH